MKHIYFLLLSIFCFNFISADPCPDQGGTTSSGGTKIIFSYSPTTSFCVNRPTTIQVNATSTFTLDLASCSETVSVYNLTSGPAITGQDFTVTSGFDTSCSYSGGTLPVEDFNTINALSIFPNPIGSEKIATMSFRFPITGKANIYNVTGKKILEVSINNSDIKEINLSSLNSGIYILKMKVDNNQVVRKLVVM